MCLTSSVRQVVPPELRSESPPGACVHVSPRALSGAERAGSVHAPLLRQRGDTPYQLDLAGRCAVPPKDKQTLNKHNIKQHINKQNQRQLENNSLLKASAEVTRAAVAHFWRRLAPILYYTILYYTILYYATPATLRLLLLLLEGEAVAVEEVPLAPLPVVQEGRLKSNTCQSYKVNKLISNVNNTLWNQTMYDAINKCKSM